MSFGARGLARLGTTRKRPDVRKRFSWERDRGGHAMEQNNTTSEVRDEATFPNVAMCMTTIPSHLTTAKGFNALEESLRSVLLEQDYPGRITGYLALPSKASVREGTGYPEKEAMNWRAVQGLRSVERVYEAFPFFAELLGSFLMATSAEHGDPEMQDAMSANLSAAAFFASPSDMPSATFASRVWCHILLCSRFLCALNSASVMLSKDVLAAAGLFRAAAFFLPFVLCLPPLPFFVVAALALGFAAAAAFCLLRALQSWSLGGVNGANARAWISADANGDEELQKVGVGTGQELVCVELTIVI
ncbi:unnamed protein product [Prorocentrum cordatum]|uniref:Uncharacterized protein n=1 Tax=Prorocentrum cordatum TaxID=2364126 RepID=A0ABN9W4D4_9DINO|nr:unnamed protein product [Polarella glacialis]